LSTVLFVGHQLNQVDQKNSIGSDLFNIEHYVHEINYPVGYPDAVGYYSAQDFGENNHLGEDWNGIGGGNTDLGDTIYAIANGYVKFAEDQEMAWGNVVRVNHFLENGDAFESMYAHCDEILIAKKDRVKAGQPIATIGDADGSYLAHLHFEIRTDTTLGVGPGYSSDGHGYVCPSSFIDSLRVVLE